MGNGSRNKKLGTRVFGGEWLSKMSYIIIIIDVIIYLMEEFEFGFSPRGNGVCQ